MSLAQPSWLFRGGFAIAYGGAAFRAGLMLGGLSRRLTLFWPLPAGTCPIFTPFIDYCCGSFAGHAPAWRTGKDAGFRRFSIGNAVGGGTAQLVSGALLQLQVSLPGLASDEASWRLR